MATIEDWRKRIDKLDKKIVTLLNERARFTGEIGKIKEKRGLPAYSPAREGEILRSVMKWNKGPLPAEVLRRLYERILDESRTLEKEAMDDRRLRRHSAGPNSSLRSKPKDLLRRRKDKR
jgi:chorismate mutase-like protein